MVCSKQLLCSAIVVFLFPAVAEARVNAAKLCEAIDGSEHWNRSVVTNHKPPSDGVEGKLLDRLQYSVMKRFGCTGGSEVPGFLDQMKHKLLGSPQEEHRAGRQQGGDLDSAALGKDATPEYCRCSLCGANANSSAAPIRYEDARREKQDYCRQLKDVKEQLRVMKEKAFEHRLHKVRFTHSTNKRTNASEKYVIITRETSHVQVNATDQEEESWPEKLQGHLRTKMALERLISEPMRLRPQECCEFCQQYYGETLAQSAPRPSVLHAALIGLCVGSAFTYAVLGVRRGASHSGREPLLAA